ncbi:hypothetical protein O1M63_39200 [Streptomyces mirabilis]|nr:hypothetical protein [Streptomyces mirabilis]
MAGDAASPGATAPLASALTADAVPPPGAGTETPSAPRPAPPRPSSTPRARHADPTAAARPAVGRAARGCGGAQRTRVRGPRRAGLRGAPGEGALPVRVPEEKALGSDELRLSRALRLLKQPSRGR